MKDNQMKSHTRIHDYRERYTSHRSGTLTVEELEKCGCMGCTAVLNDIRHMKPVEKSTAKVKKLEMF